MTVLDRFLRYVAVDTRADESSTTCPSTPGQLVLQRLLAEELRAIGLADVNVDDNGYLMATVPATPGCDAPIVGFIAHVDTSPEMSGANVKPLVHRAWDGRNIVLPDDASAVLRAAARLLRPGGLLVMEHAEVQDAAVRADAQATGAFEQIESRDDLTGRPRMLLARRSSHPLVTASAP